MLRNALACRFLQHCVQIQANVAATDYHQRRRCKCSHIIQTNILQSVIVSSQQVHFAAHDYSPAVSIENNSVSACETGDKAYKHYPRALKQRIPMQLVSLAQVFIVYCPVTIEISQYVRSIVVVCGIRENSHVQHCRCTEAL